MRAVTLRLLPIVFRLLPIVFYERLCLFYRLNEYKTDLGFIIYYLGFFNFHTDEAEGFYFTSSSLLIENIFTGSRVHTIIIFDTSQYAGVSHSTTM